MGFIIILLKLTDFNKFHNGTRGKLNQILIFFGIIKIGIMFQ